MRALTMDGKSCDTALLLVLDRSSWSSPWSSPFSDMAWLTGQSLARANIVGRGDVPLQDTSIGTVVLATYHDGRERVAAILCYSVTGWVHVWPWSTRQPSFLL